MPTSSVLPLSAAALHALRLAVLGGAAAANLASASSLLQAHLNLGFSNWYVVRHMSGVDEALKQRSASHQTRLAVIVSAKVALQMLALPALQFAALALLLLHCAPSGLAARHAREAAAHAAALAEADPAAAASSGGSGGSGGAAAADLSPLEAIRRMVPELSGPPSTPAAAAAAAAAAARLAAPSALAGAVGGFVAWWATAAWTAGSAAALLLIRSGVINNLGVA